MLGAIFILRKDIGVGSPENDNFPLLYVVKMSFVGRWVVQKSLKTPLHNMKMAPYVSYVTSTCITIVMQGLLNRSSS